MGRDQERPYAGVALWGLPGAPGRAERLWIPKSSLPAAELIAGRWDGHHRPPSSLPGAELIAGRPRDISHRTSSLPAAELIAGR